MFCEETERLSSQFFSQKLAVCSSALTCVCCTRNVNLMHMLREESQTGLQINWMLFLYVVAKIFTLYSQAAGQFTIMWSGHSRWHQVGLPIPRLKWLVDNSVAGCSICPTYPKCLDIFINNCNCTKILMYQLHCWLLC